MPIDPEEEAEDLDLTLDDSQETEDEEQDDPLAAFDDDQIALIERLAQERATAEINAFKGQYGRRMGAAITDARSKGLDVGEDGAILIRDAKLAAQALGISQAEAERQQAQQQSAATDPLDAPIDAYNDDPETVNAKIQRQIQKGIAQAIGPLQASVYTPALTGAPAIGRTALETYGLGGYADHPEFAAGLQQALQQGFPQEQWSDPEAVAIAALALLPQLAKTLPQEVQPQQRRSVDPAASAAAAARQNIASVGAPRGSAGSRTAQNAYTEDEIAEAAEQERLFGIKTSPAQVRALRNGADVGSFAAAGKGRR